MKKISGYENYFVTTCGKVISLKGEKIKILKQTLGKDGYLYISLSRNGRVKKFKIHRLVAFEYIQIEKGKNIVNHKNECKTDNYKSNLEWVNKSENLFHGTAYERMIDNQKNIKKVIKKNKKGDILKIYKSLRSVEKDGFDRRHVKKCCDKEKHHHTHKSFIWEYQK
jgi:hypothetical protein